MNQSKLKPSAAQASKVFIAAVMARANMLSLTQACGEAEYELDKKFYPVLQSDMRAQVLYE